MIALPQNARREPSSAPSVTRADGLRVLVNRGFAAGYGAMLSGRGVAAFDLGHFALALRDANAKIRGLRVPAISEREGLAIYRAQFDHWVRRH